MNACVDCGAPISRDAARCRSCSKRGNTYATGRPARPVDMGLAERTIARVAASAGLAPGAIKSASKARHLTPLRHAVMILLADQGVPCSRASALMGRTQQSGSQMIEAARRRYDADAQFRAKVERLRREITQWTNGHGSA